MTHPLRMALASDAPTGGAAGANAFSPNGDARGLFPSSIEERNLGQRDIGRRRKRGMR